MADLVHSDRAASMRRMAVVGIGTFIVVLLVAALVLWIHLGSTVFFELIAAGIAYCF